MEPRISLLAMELCSISDRYFDDIGGKLQLSVVLDSETWLPTLTSLNAARHGLVLIPIAGVIILPA